MRRIAINGFGRIGRTFLRILLQRQEKDLEIVAVNDLSDPENLAYAFKYDSVHGKWKTPFETEKNHFIVDGRKIAVLNEPDPSRLPWKEWNVEGVIECSGKFTNREGALKHLQAGARKVLVSAPARDADLTITMGVNEDQYDPQRHHIVSILDLVAQTRAPVDVPKILEAFRKAEQNPRLAPILQVSEEELVSIDYVGSPYSAVIDAPSTMVVGEHLLRVMAWYDNEWGFSNRLVDVIKLL